MFRVLRRLAGLAYITLLDGLRRHALIGLVLLALLAEAGGLFFFDFIPRDIGRVTRDYIFAINLLAGLLFLFFHAVQVISWDEERRVIHSLLARPISRAEYVIGVYVGLALLILFLNVLLGSIGYAILTYVKRSVASYYFPDLSLIAYVIGVVGLLMTEFAILAIIMLFSGLVRGSFPVLLLSLSYYMICNGLPVVRDSLGTRLLGNVDLTIFKNQLTVLTAFFPDYSRLDYKRYVVVEQAMPPGNVLLTDIGLFLGYTVVILGFSCIVYSRRDLK